MQQDLPCLLVAHVEPSTILKRRELRACRQRFDALVGELGGSVSGAPTQVVGTTDHQRKAVCVKVVVEAAPVVCVCIAVIGLMSHSM